MTCACAQCLNRFQTNGYSGPYIMDYMVRTSPSFFKNPFSRLICVSHLLCSILSIPFSAHRPLHSLPDPRDHHQPGSGQRLALGLDRGGPGFLHDWVHAGGDSIREPDAPPLSRGRPEANDLVSDCLFERKTLHSRSIVSSTKVDVVFIACRNKQQD